MKKTCGRGSDLGTHRPTPTSRTPASERHSQALPSSAHWKHPHLPSVCQDGSSPACRPSPRPREATDLGPLVLSTPARGAPSRSGCGWRRFCGFKLWVHSRRLLIAPRRWGTASTLLLELGVCILRGVSSGLPGDGGTVALGVRLALCHHCGEGFPSCGGLHCPWNRPSYSLNKSSV